MGLGAGVVATFGLFDGEKNKSSFLVDTGGFVDTVKGIVGWKFELTTVSLFPPQLTSDTGCENGLVCSTDNGATVVGCR